MDQPLSARWRLIQACAEGTSHQGTGVPCQDSCFSDVIEEGDTSALVIAVADGAGSSRYGGEGAEHACVAAFDAVARWARRAGLSASPSAEDLAAWATHIHEGLEGKAREQGTPAREFACTLLIAVCTSTWSAYLQVGDGAIVVRDAQGLRPVFWPDAGEYANTTYFITDARYAEHLMVVTAAAPVDDIAVMTDGLQRLALNFIDQSAHAAFFEPLFHALRRQPFDEVAAVEASLQSLLDSPSVNARTDDDKTLVLASLEQPG